MQKPSMSMCVNIAEYKDRLIEYQKQRIGELEGFILEGFCPSADGFEGPETFPDCGKCEYCKLKANQADEP